jgi:DNA-directed RNA polymerase subunit omega
MFTNEAPQIVNASRAPERGLASGAIGYPSTAGSLVAWLARGAAVCMHAREGHKVAGTPAVEGIINPPIDDLLEVVDSKYGLVIMASKRARQINAYYAQLSEGLLEYVGPLVETRVQEKPLSIALREISEGLVSAEEAES